MNEHVSSTGINDCITDFSPDCFQTGRRQRGSFGFACDAFTNRNCSLPRPDIFETFWDVSDVDGNGRLTEEELGTVADRDCPGPPTTPCECALPRSSGDCQLGDDEFTALDLQQLRANVHCPAAQAIANSGMMSLLPWTSNSSVRMCIAPQLRRLPTRG